MEILKFNLDTSSPANPYVSEVLKGGKTFSIVFPEGSSSALFIQQSADGTKWQSKQSVSPTNKATVNAPADGTTYLRVLVSVRPQSASYKDYSGGGGGSIDTEVDPTVPSWAKQPTKPTYTAAEVGAATISEFKALKLKVHDVEDDIKILKKLFPTEDADNNGIPDGEDRLRKIEEDTKIIVNEDGIVL